jgi:ABC-type polysaccharide/polyol phosphate export permease
VIVFLHNLLIFIGVAVYGGVPVTPASFLVIPALALVFVNGVWVTLLVGMLCARFRDVQQVITSLLQISMFITPIFFRSEQLGPQFVRFVDFNALFHYVDIVRSPLLGRAPALWSWIVVFVGTVVGWAITLWLFSRFRRRLSYWL